VDESEFFGLKTGALNESRTDFARCASEMAEVLEIPRARYELILK
jgi:hypothetical protein